MDIKSAYEVQNVLGKTIKGRPITEEAKQAIKEIDPSSIEKFASCKNCGLIFDCSQSTFPCGNCGSLDFKIKEEVL